MDIFKLFQKVLEDRSVQDIPVLYILLVVNSVIEAINTGECFYPIE